MCLKASKHNMCAMPGAKGFISVCPFYILCSGPEVLFNVVNDKSVVNQDAEQESSASKLKVVVCGENRLGKHIFKVHSYMFSSKFNSRQEPKPYSLLLAILWSNLYHYLCFYVRSEAAFLFRSWVGSAGKMLDSFDSPRLLSTFVKDMITSYLQWDAVVASMGSFLQPLTRITVQKYYGYMMRLTSMIAEYKNKRNAPDGILPGVFYSGAELLFTEHRTKATSHLQLCFVFNIFMYIQYILLTL